MVNHIKVKTNKIYVSLSNIVIRKTRFKIAHNIYV